MPFCRSMTIKAVFESSVVTVMRSSFADLGAGGVGGLAIQGGLERAHREKSVCGREGVHDLFAQHLLGRSRGAAAERPVAGAAIEARDGVFVGEAVAAVNLDGLAG